CSRGTGRRKYDMNRQRKKGGGTMKEGDPRRTEQADPDMSTERFAVFFSWVRSTFECPLYEFIIFIYLCECVCVCVCVCVTVLSLLLLWMVVKLQLKSPREQKPTLSISHSSPCSILHSPLSLSLPPSLSFAPSLSLSLSLFAAE